MNHLCWTAVCLSFLVCGMPQRANAADEAGELPKNSQGRELNLDFETGTLADWTAEGEAFAKQPVKGDTVAARRNDMRSNHQGDYWIGGYETGGDDPTGTLTSAAFPITQPFATFLMNGGTTADTRVELLNDAGKSIFEAVGTMSEEMRQVVVDLRKFQGQEIRIRLVDSNRDGWGHINFDNFRFHAEQPGELTPTLVRLVPDEYPYAGLPGEKAAEVMQLPEGFHVLLAAEEPAVQQPVAMAIDERGRVWIAEAFEYPRRAPDGQGHDRILVFEDTTGDGKLDSRKVFFEGLNLVSGLEVGFGGVYVGAAPYFMFIPDANHDDVPDGPPQILLDGWGYHDTHETLNTFNWGPDGWLYGCHGVFTHSRVGKPGTPDDQRTPINAGIWRYHPTRHVFEVFSEGTSNPWGVDFNDQGQAFCTACVIPHLYHMIQGGRYQRQAGNHFNPYTYDDIKTIADHLHYLGANPHGGNSKSDAAGGGHAHAGAMIYLGGAWPQKYRNELFMNNIHGQRLNVDVLHREGSGYVGSHGPDFLLTGDEASQILNLRYGPDGQAYMIDWYDMQACHRPEISRHDRTNGRIYKIVYGENKPVQVNLLEKTDLELAEYVLENNDWYVRNARKMLQERASTVGINTQARVRLAEIAAQHPDATRRLRALWALHVTGGIEPDLQSQLFADASPYVRGWTIQLSLAEAGAQIPQGLLEQFTKMAAEDNSPVVRLYLAAATQRMPLESRWNILERLASHAEDADDHNLPLMYWYAAEPLAESNPDRALAFGLSAGESIPVLREYMLRRIGSSNSGDSLAVLVRGLKRADSAPLQLTFLTAIRTALKGQRRVDAPDAWSEVSSHLLNSDNEEVKLQARALGITFGDAAAMQSFRELVTADQAPLESRREALEALIAANDPQLAPTLLTLVKSEDLRDVALLGLAQYDDPQTPKVLIANYDKFSPEARRKALATLCSRAGYGLALLTAIGEKKVPGTDLTADLVRQLQYLKNEKIDEQLESVWGNVRETPAEKLKLIADYQALVASPGQADPMLGRAVFSKTCQRCHTLYGLGAHVGPDLTGSNRANLEYLISNIVDPSAVMAKEYQQSLFITVDGRIVTGIVKDEDENSVTVQTAEAQVVIPKDEIDERMASDLSMMPDNQLKQFTESEIRGLIAYLSDKHQFPMLATKENAVTFFNGKDLTGWNGDASLWSVEDGELVGRTDGLDHNEFLISDLAAADFKLALDVKLVNNEGNSGVQFRSEVIEGGEVKGYQADIGAGWWGKLYEEQGRALLWDQSGENLITPGEWTHYEIVAQGSKIQTFLNGKLSVDLDDPEGAKRGIFALQLHAGGKTEVRYRNIELTILDAEGTAAAAP